METDEVDFNSDIEKYGNNFIKSLSINNVNININLIEYNDINIIDMINNWNMCLNMLDKSFLFKNKNVMKIIYCLLTDCCVIKNINGNNLDLDLFDPVLEKFLRVDVVNEKSRDIRLRVFTVCNTLIIFDCKDLSNYKIYEIFNIDQIKKHYDSHKINFDKLINEMKIEPKIKSNLNNLTNDFKKHTVSNCIKNDKEDIIIKLDKFLLTYNKMEKKIQTEYIKFYKSIIIHRKK
jgi:hypothetical protein